MLHRPMQKTEGHLTRENAEEMKIGKRNGARKKVEHESDKKAEKKKGQERRMKLRKRKN